MHLTAVGINFRDTPVELREKLTIRATDVSGVLEQMRSRAAQTELFLLSTCNRTELYAAGTEADTSPEHLTDLLLGDAGDRRRQLLPYLYQRHQLEALEHLMNVAASLDSMVVGETEIFGQVKQAYGAAQEANRGRLPDAGHPARSQSGQARAHRNRDFPGSGFGRLSGRRTGGKSLR